MGDDSSPIKELALDATRKNMDGHTEHVAHPVRKRFGRLGFFTALNISCLILGCMLILVEGNGTLAVFFLMAPLTGVVSWFANRGREDLSSRYYPAMVAMLRNATSRRFPAWSWRDDKVLLIALIAFAMLLLCVL